MFVADAKLVKDSECDRKRQIGRRQRYVMSNDHIFFVIINSCQNENAHTVCLQGCPDLYLEQNRLSNAFFYHSRRSIGIDRKSIPENHFCSIDSPAKQSDNKIYNNIKMNLKVGMILNTDPYMSDKLLDVLFCSLYVVRLPNLLNVLSLFLWFLEIFTNIDQLRKSSKKIQSFKLSNY